MNLSIIIRYFEELEEEFKVFSGLTFKEFSEDKHLDNPELRGFIYSYVYNAHSSEAKSGFSLKNKIYYLIQLYETINSEVDVQIIIEVLEKYYE